MRPLFYGQVGAAVPFYALVVVFAAAEQRTRLRSILNRGGARVDHGSFFAVAICIGAGIAGAFVIASDVGATAIGNPARWPLFILGLVLIALGIALRQWAIALLGRFFTVDVRVADDQTVIDTGPYAHVRHPSYTGLMLTLLGIGLALTNWLSLICAVVPPLAGLIIRVRVEEAALIAGLGEPYRRYAAGRARLIPRVW